MITASATPAREADSLSCPCLVCAKTFRSHVLAPGTHLPKQTYRRRPRAPGQQVQ